MKSVCLNILGITLYTTDNIKWTYFLQSLIDLVLSESRSRFTSSHSGLEMMLTLTQRGAIALLKQSNCPSNP